MAKKREELPKLAITRIVAEGAGAFIGEESSLIHLSSGAQLVKSRAYCSMPFQRLRGIPGVPFPTRNLCGECKRIARSMGIPLITGIAAADSDLSVSLEVDAEDRPIVLGMMRQADAIREEIDTLLRRMGQLETLGRTTTADSLVETLAVLLIAERTLRATASYCAVSDD